MFLFIFLTNCSFPASFIILSVDEYSFSIYYIYIFSDMVVKQGRHWGGGSKRECRDLIEVKRRMGWFHRAQEKRDNSLGLKVARTGKKTASQQARTASENPWVEGLCAVCASRWFKLAQGFSTFWVLEPKHRNLCRCGTLSKHAM